MDITIQKYEAKDGNSTLSINELFIHSKYKPVEEAKSIAGRLYKPHHLQVVFGYGLGYVVDELIKLCQFNEPILVLDPLLDSGDLKMMDHQYKRLYTQKLSDFQTLENLVSQLTSYSNKVTSHVQSNYEKLFTEALVKVLEIVKDAQIREIYNVNTVNLFAMKWQINTFMGMKSIINDKSLSELYDKYSAPIVVASGGPSLTKQLPLVKKYRDNIILICAGTTINTLLKHNVNPDFVVTIDGGEVNYNHFKDLTITKSNVIYTPTNHFKIRDSFKTQGYVFIPSGVSSLVEYYKRKIDRVYPEVLGGGSVAHYALSLAKRLTSAPICLIGQDLAYTNDQSHAEGNKNAQSIEKEILDIVNVEGYYGGKVKSNDSFKTMIYTFEQMELLQKHRNKLFNCTEGGAKINLIEQMPFAEFLSTYANQPIEQTIDFVYDDSSVNEDYFKAYVKKEISNYEEIIDILESGIKITKKERGPLFNQSTLTKLSKIDKKLNKLYIENNLDSLLQPVIYFNEVKYLPNLNESKYEEFERVKNYTINLYNDCKQQIIDYIDEIKKVLEETNEHE